MAIHCNQQLNVQLSSAVHQLSSSCPPPSPLSSHQRPTLAFCPWRANGWKLLETLEHKLMPLAITLSLYSKCPVYIYKKMYNILYTVNTWYKNVYLYCTLATCIYRTSTCMDSRVFRFTSTLEFRFEAWGAHADRYDRATDQKKSYRPINNKIGIVFCLS